MPKWNLTGTGGNCTARMLNTQGGYWLATRFDDALAPVRGKRVIIGQYEGTDSEPVRQYSISWRGWMRFLRGRKGALLSPVAQLAAAFSRQVRTELSEAELKQVNDENARRGYDDTCATHDLYDANELMAAAILEAGADLEHLWNPAWDMAKRAGFSL